MKLQLRLLALCLASFMVFAYAAPDKPQSEGGAVTETAAEEPAKAPAVKVSAPGEEAVGDLLLQAMSLIGVAYRWGGSNPQAGLDCSGFIQYIFKKSLNLTLPRTAAEMAHSGRAIDKAELAPGDLVFFNTLGPRNSHVGMYIGNGKFIHSPRTGKSVEVSNLSQSYWVAHYNGARRMTRGADNKVERVAEADTVVASAGSGDSAAVVVRCRKGRKHCVSASKAGGRHHGGAAKATVKKGKKKKHGHGG
jgi:hypothetical protein